MSARSLILLLAGVALVAGFAWTMVSYRALARRIPAEVKRQVASEFAQGKNLAWCLYRVEGRTTWVVVDYTDTENRYGGLPASLALFRIADDQHTCATVHWTGDPFLASMPSFGRDSEGRPTSQLVFGVVRDSTVAKITATIADGRTAEATVQDGYWWIEGSMTAAAYAKDQWTKITATDAKGKTLYETVPDYSGAFLK
jgi:hypothetical protein